MFQNENNNISRFFFSNLCFMNLIQNEQCNYYSDNKIECYIFLHLRGQCVFNSHDQNIISPTHLENMSVMVHFSFPPKNN